MPSFAEEDNESDEDDFDDDYYNQEDDEMEDTVPVESQEAKVDEE
jgi:hypothetical protein